MTLNHHSCIYGNITLFFSTVLRVVLARATAAEGNLSGNVKTLNWKCCNIEGHFFGGLNCMDHVYIYTYIYMVGTSNFLKFDFFSHPENRTAACYFSSYL
jgi:hypothetical protein